MVKAIEQKDDKLFKELIEIYKPDSFKLITFIGNAGMIGDDTIISLISSIILKDNVHGKTYHPVALGGLLIELISHCHNELFWKYLEMCQSKYKIDKNFWMTLLYTAIMKDNIIIIELLWPIIQEGNLIIQDEQLYKEIISKSV